MNKKVVLIITMLAVSLCIIPNLSFAIGMEVAVGGWGQGPSGDISYKSDAANDKLDIEDDLNYDRQYKVFGRAKVDMPGLLPNIYFIGTLMKFEEPGSKLIDFKFGDETFDVTDPYETLLELNHYDVALYYSIPFLGMGSLGKLNVDVGLNARIVDFKAQVSGTVSGSPTTVTEEFTIPVPMVYVGVQVKPTDMFRLEGELRGIAYDSNHYYDLIGRVKVRPVPMLFIAGGYRHEDIKIDHDDIMASITFSGPFVEAGLEF